MQVIHEFKLQTRCPVNDAHDHYTVELTVNRFVAVEEILATVETLHGVKEFQESITERLAVMFAPCAVTSIGTHTRVKTTCTVWS